MQVGSQAQKGIALLMESSGPASGLELWTFSELTVLH